MEQVVNSLDRGQPFTAEFEQPPEPMELAAEGFARFMAWIWRSESDTRRAPDMQSAFRRFVAVSATMQPGLLNGLGFRELGEQLNCTKAALSKQGREFSERFGGLQFRRQHGGIDNMRKAAFLAHRKRHNEN